MRIFPEFIFWHFEHTTGHDIQNKYTYNSQIKSGYRYHIAQRKESLLCVAKHYIQRRIYEIKCSDKYIRILHQADFLLLVTIKEIKSLFMQKFVGTKI